MKNAIYLRKSRQDEGGLEETLRKHKEILLDFAVKNNIQISDDDIYEETISGESLYARPEMLKLLQNIDNGMYNAVLCVDVDRLGRGGMSDQGIIFETFKNNDTKIITPRKVYDLNDEFDEDNIEFESFMARRELKIIKRRLKRGTKKSIEEGCYLANAPYGYKNTVVNKKHTLEIVEDEARIVRTIFDLYVNKGMGCQSIAYAINAMGAKPRRTEQFGRTTVMFILKNNVYIGKIVWDKKTHIRKNTRGNSKHIVIYNDKDKWTVCEGLHPPIIDMETWNKAQQIIAERTHPPTNKGEIKNVLSHLIYCGNCGGLMTRTISRGSKNDTKNKKYYYSCKSKGCIKATQCHYVDDIVINTLRYRFKDMVLDIAEQNNVHYIDYSSQIKGIKSELKKLDTQLNSLHDLLEQGIYDIPTFMDRQKTINMKKSELNNQLDIIDKKTSENKMIDEISMMNRIQSVLDVFDRATPQEKNQLLRTIVEKITYYKKPSDPTDKCRLVITLKPVFF